MSIETLHDRLSSVASGATYRSLAQLTETHPETVRRYMQGQSPSVEFLASVCRALSVNADWLLTGRGPQRADQVRAHALREANPTELHAAIASTISTLVERVDRLETYCQTLETRVRVAAPRGERPGDTLPSLSDEQAEPPEVVTKARRIASSLAQRPPRDADRTPPPPRP